jgi:hypothetical protein
MVRVSVEIQCGESTCAKERGKFCKFFGARDFGTVPVCSLFPSENHTFTDLEVSNGWVQRCKSCLESTK